jgi:hypothetical protein
MCTCPLFRGRPSTSHSTEISTRRHRCRCRCRRRPGTLSALAALGTLSSSAVATADARPLPIPFLDFLYPSWSWFTLQSSAVPAPTVASTSNVKKATSVAKKAKNLAKRNLPVGLRVPVKFESADMGWIVAESWDLHGRHRRSDVRDLFPSFLPNFWRHFPCCDCCFYSWTWGVCGRNAGRFVRSISNLPSSMLSPLFLNPPSSL